MSLSALELARVALCLDKELRGAMVRKVLCPALPGRLCLELRGLCENHLLLAVVHGDATRLHRIKARPRSAEVPHPFVMLLRRELVGLALVAAEQLQSDRVVSLRFAAGSRRADLVCELTSKHSNAFLVDDTGRIQGSLYPNRSSRRALVPGELYEPPAPHDRGCPEPCRFDSSAPIEPQIEVLYSASDAASELLEERAVVNRLLVAARHKLDRLQGALEGDRARADRAEELSTYGQLLKANLRQVPRGASTVSLLGWDGVAVDVPLDPRLGPVENMERLFEKARRLRRAVGIIERRQLETLEKLEALDAYAIALPEANTAQVAAIRDAICQQHPGLRPRLPRSKQAQYERLPYKEIPISAGRSARVGRSAKDNDALTLRHCRPDDLWLHVRGRAGSHVVVPMGRLEDPSPEILIDAAHLAAHFSQAQGQAIVEVIYTRRRYVAKPRGAAAGSVRLLKEKTLLLELEPERLARLLGKAPESDQ